MPPESAGDMLVDLQIDVGGLPSFVNLDEYFGLWAVEEGRFMAILSHVSDIDLRAHVQAGRVNPGPKQAQTDAAGDVTIALVSISGVMTKRGSSFSDAGATSMIRQQIRAAARDPNIDAIMLVVDSPGGSVSGTADLAADIAAAAKQKPLYAFVEDMGASAAYWSASQATKVFANNDTALVGSIGTFVGMYDSSARAEKKGIKAIVIRAGEHKGTGFPGTKITDEQQAIWQSVIDETQKSFTAGVASGRGISLAQAEALADGRIHAAGDALKLGLIDGIQSYEATLSQLREAALAGRSTTKGAPKMSQTQTTTEPSGPKAATYAELKAALVGADAAFLCSQLEAGHTVSQATTAWMTEQSSRNVALATDLKAAKDAQAAAAAKPGLKPLAEKTKPAPESEGAADPISAWHDAVAAEEKLLAHVKPDHVRRTRAMSNAISKDPQMHADYINAYNIAKGNKKGATFESN